MRGTLLGELGRYDEARTELELAERLARNAHERAQVRAKLTELSRSTQRQEGHDS